MGAMVIDRNQTRVCAREQLRVLPGGGTEGVRFPARRGSRGALLASRRSSSAGGQAAGAALSGPHHGLFPATLTRLVRQRLATGGLTKRYRPPAQGVARKCTVADVALLAETKRPRHALGTRHPALAAARRLRLRGHPHCAAGQERRRGAQVLRRQPSAALCNVNQRLLRHIPQPLAQLPATLPVRRGH